MPLTKITVMIHKKLLETFNKQMKALHMKRDAFLDSMIQGEIKHLAEDMKGRQLSAAARRYIAGELKRLGTRKVNLQIEQTTADELNRIVANTNLVRDAFINRLILLLRSSPLVLRTLELPEFITYSDFEQWVEPLPTSPLRALEAVHADPLYYIRSATEERHKTGLYLLSLPKQFTGFACYLSDDEVPGTDAHKKAQEEFAHMFDELGFTKEEPSTETGKKGDAS